MSLGEHWLPSSASPWPAAGRYSPAATAADVPAPRKGGVCAGAPRRRGAAVGGAPAADGGPPPAPGTHLRASPAERPHDAVPQRLCGPGGAHALPRLLPPGLAPQLAAAARARQPPLPHRGGGWTASQPGLSLARLGAPTLAEPSRLALQLRGQLRLGLHQLPRLPSPRRPGLRLFLARAEGRPAPQALGLCPCAGAVGRPPHARAGLLLPRPGPFLAAIHHASARRLARPPSGVSVRRARGAGLPGVGRRPAAFPHPSRGRRPVEGLGAPLLGEKPLL